jgi:hypothetical protein
MSGSPSRRGEVKGKSNFAAWTKRIDFARKAGHCVGTESARGWRELPGALDPELCPQPKNILEAGAGLDGPGSLLRVPVESCRKNHADECGACQCYHGQCQVRTDRHEKYDSNGQAQAKSIG